MATAYFRHLMNALKIVLVGDAEVGKTWLVSRAKELYFARLLQFNEGTF